MVLQVQQSQSPNSGPGLCGFVSSAGINRQPALDAEACADCSTRMDAAAGPSPYNPFTKLAKGTCASCDEHPASSRGSPCVKGRISSTTIHMEHPPCDAQELDQLEDARGVFKLIGPTLIRQDPIEVTSAAEMYRGSIHFFEGLPVQLGHIGL